MKKGKFLFAVIVIVVIIIIQPHNREAILDWLGHQSISDQFGFN